MRKEVRKSRGSLFAGEQPRPGEDWWPKGVASEVHLVVKMKVNRPLVLGIVLVFVVSMWDITQARKFKSDGPIRSNERIKIDDPTAKANPNIAVESAPFDPLLLEMEEERDDREWEKRYMKLHHGKQFHGHVDDPLQHMAHAEGFDDDHHGDWENEEIAEEFAKYRNEDDDAQWDDHDAHEMLDEGTVGHGVV